MEEIIIRKIEAKDIEEIISIGSKEKAFEVDDNIPGMFWEKAELKDWILSDDDPTLVAVCDNEIIGFVLLSHHIPTSKITVEDIWTRKDFRKKGVAKKLLKKGLLEAKEKGAAYVCTFVKTNNIPAEKLFTNSDFQKGNAFSWIHKIL